MTEAERRQPEEAAPFSFEHHFEETSEGGYDTWIIIDVARGRLDPLARCDRAEDAMFVVSALNQMHDEGRL